MMWRRMLARFRLLSTDEELKAAARQETERLKAELSRMDIQIEMATHHTIKELEARLRPQQEQPQ